MTDDATLLDVLLGAVAAAPAQVIVQVAGDGSEHSFTFSQLFEESRRVASGLSAAGLRPGSAVIVLPQNAVDFLPSFWGSLAAGLVPVPLAPVPDKVAAVWAHLGRPPLLVTTELARLAAQLVVPDSSAAPHLLRLDELRESGPIGDFHRPGPDDVAFLQFSSGSTGAPKGVRLTHANVVANLQQATTASGLSAADVMVSWLPYFHDMGLIGAHLTPLSLGIKQVKLDAGDFAARPALWYETATRHAATLLPMASFALALTLKRVSAQEVAALDLSSVRLVGVGAEPIPVSAWRRFLTHLAPAGLKPSVLAPVYGLAEATLAVAFPPLGEVAQPLRLDRQQLTAGCAVNVADTSPETREPPAEFFDVGYPVSGGQLRIVAEDGEVLADSRVGQIEFRGPNVALGYHQQPEATSRTFVDGWLRTGDVGFLRAGRLCVTGRTKDVIFVHGQKFHAHDLEQLVTATAGVPAGRVGVVGVTDPVTGVERVAVFVSSGGRITAEVAPTLAAVRARVRESVGYDNVAVLPIPPADFPRTTSGKVQRSVLRERLTAGAFANLEAEVEALMSRSSTPTLSAPARRGDVETRITQIWAEVLEVSATSISRDDRFLAIGGTSLSAMHVLARLEESFGRSLQPSLLRDNATVAALAEQLADHPEPERTLDVGPRATAGSRSDPAAIVGMACRFPDASTPEAFWQNLAAGRDSVTEVPPSRWLSAPGAPSRRGGFLDDVAGFDAGFFGVDPTEAAVMDPHARIFLEVAHEALERAGYAGERRRGRRIGVFVAVGESGYASLVEQALDNGAALPPSALVGNLRSVIAARVAHQLDLSGPAMVVDTACSSALVALHLARRSLEAGECDAAVVGGVSLNLTPSGYRLLETAQALSPTGRSRAFSAGADGFVPGEGAAALVLEPLSAATSAGDQVLAVVRGSTINNDGRSLSLMAPNPQLQEAVIADAYRDAGIDPATVSYVEAHGTGTAIGDPIEARSLIRTFSVARDDGPRWLGSVKTNIGHLLNAAGMPGLIKVVLSLGHRALPPSLHYADPSASFDLAAAGFQVVTGLRDWTADGLLRAGVNGFGFGGTNAHVILEEAPPPAAQPKGHSGPQLLTLSAATEPALRDAARQLADHTREHPEADVADLCHSASTARDAGLHRLALVVEGDLGQHLDRAARAATVGTSAHRRPRVAWLFPGQGAQVPGLSRSLYRQRVYRQVLDELSASAGEVRGRTLTAWSLDDVAPAELAHTEVAQPLLVAYGIALAAQLSSWEIRPDAVVGHSVGELAALAVAGALPPAAAVRLAVERGRLMQQLCPAGGMAALAGSVAEVQTVLDRVGPHLSVAAVNGPARVVVSGPDDAIDAVLAAWTKQGRPGQRLSASRPFHSAGMDPALERLQLLAAPLTQQPWQIPLLSTVDADWGPTLDADYLAAQARQPVQFQAAVQRLLTEGFDTLLTVEPGTTLRSLTTAIVRSEGRSSGVTVLSTLNQADDDEAALLGTVGRLWERGVAITRPVGQPPRLRQPVPTYPFERRPYWLPEPGDQPAGLVVPAKPEVSELLHRFDWPEAPLPAGVVLTSVGIVGSHPTLGPALTDALARRGITVHSRPLARLDELLDVSVLVLLAGPGAELDDAADLDRVTRSAADVMPTLARRLARRPAALVVVTEDVALTGASTERARPGQAVVTGLALALAQENSEHGVRVVDLSTLDDGQTRLEALIRELDAPPTAGSAESVAWRQGRRLTRTPQLHGVGAASRPQLPVSGSYLITGGAGGVGAALARALAGRGTPRLYLVGRALRCADELLDELAARGAQADYLSADCAEAAQVEALVTSLTPLDGVFHAAGILTPGRLGSSTSAEVEAGLVAKVRGSFLLSRALARAGNRPATFVCFSSISSALPGHAGGIGTYAAGNAFLDAFAAAEQQAGRPMQVLNLPVVAGTGMAASAAFGSLVTSQHLPQISAEQAVQAVLDATMVDATQLLVLDTAQTPVDAPSRPVRVIPRQLSTRLDGEPPVSSGSVRDAVAALIGAELGLPPDDLDDHASLLSMGLDSLTAVDLVRKLEAQLGRELPTTLLFEHPTIAQLSAHLTTNPAAAAAVTRPPSAASTSMPLSPVQLAFHTSSRLYPDVSAHSYLRQTIRGDLDEELLGQSLAELERRHPMLRLRIRTVEGQPLQSIDPSPDGDQPSWFTRRQLSARGPAGDRPDPSLQEVEDELCNRVFDLSEEGPLRAVLLRAGAGRSHLLLLLHHAAADGASLHLICAELWRVYTSLTQHHAPELAPLTSTFHDYVTLGDEQRASDDFAADLRYWEKRLATRDLPAGLPYDGDPSTDPSAPLTAQQFRLQPDVTQALQQKAARIEVSLFHLVLSAYLAALARWTGESQVTVNVARAGREVRLPDIGRLVGPFADTLPISVNVDPDRPDDLPRAVRAAWRDSEQHGTVSSLDLARLILTSGAGPRTVGAAGFSFARFAIALPPDCPVHIVDTAARTASAATRLSLICWEFDDTLRFSWNYPARLFNAPTIERFTRELLAGLSALTQPDLVEQSRHSIARRIQERARQTPHAAAVQTDDEALSYGQLDRAAGQLAARLHSNGIRANDRVGLLTQPGAATVIGLLGILYTGATWVPLDPQHPQARLHNQLERAEAKAVVAHDPTDDLAALLGPQVMLLDSAPSDGDNGQASPEAHPVADPRPDDIAYVMFTSGTTGQPKGVPISHRSMGSYLDWAVSTFGYRATDRMLATASICFDASVRQLLAPLLVGATIVATTRDTVRDPRRLLDLVEQRRVTVWSSVPTLWEQVLRAAERQVATDGSTPDLSALRWVHVGGEALPAGPVRRWFDLFGPHQRIVNLYGPTEATINATSHVVDARPDDAAVRIPIGRPVADTVLDVVDAEQASCPVGEPGELWVSGPGLTPGYLSEPNLTARAFVQRAGMRYYRTGDRVVQLPDGSLEFLGRMDQQVKIRGHRVEPGEVEAVLGGHPSVARAVVVAQPADVGGHRLLSYVQLTGERPAVTSDALRSYLVEQLPDYLVPAQVAVVDQLPLTVAGKVNIAALASLQPVPSTPDESRLRTPPQTPTERVLASIWQEVLRVDQVSQEDDFFALGGDSIGVLEVFARLEPHLPQLPAPTVLYKHRTLAELAAALTTAQAEAPASRPKVGDNGGPFPLSPAQRGFLLAEAWSPDARTGWLATFRLTGPLDPTYFQQAVDRLVNRHPMLRTVISAQQRPPVQAELRGPAPLVVQFDAVEAAALDQRLAEERRHRFDPAGWPLIRLQVLRTGAQEHLLVVHAHHLIGDGYSAVVLAQDLLALYDNVVDGARDPLPPLRSTFRDYVALTQTEPDSAQPRQPQPYTAPSLRRPETTSSEAVRAVFTLDRGVTAQLRQTALDASVTPYAPVLTAYYRSLTRLTNQRDLLLGVAVSGRDHALPDLHRIVGALATVIPVLLNSPDATFTQQLPQVAEAVLGARSGGATIRQRVEGSVGAAELSSFGAQFLFSYLDFDALGPIEGQQLQLAWDDRGTDLEPPPVGTDLLLTARLVDGCLQVTIRASRGVLDAAELDRFTADVHQELAEATHPAAAAAFTWPRSRESAAQTPAPVLDAALIGYLPAPHDLAALADIPDSDDVRESIRSALFPGGQPRLLEVLSTPLGRSGFVCLPLFADELPHAATSTLAADVARAVHAAADQGARAVSLAGMIPAHTAYGFDVTRALTPAATTVTTGHATTAASVVKTTLQALQQSGAELSERTLTVIGLGSIGWSSLQLLLALDVGTPKQLLLCDVAGRAQHLKQLTAQLRALGHRADYAVCGPDLLAPAQAYTADLIIAAISAERPVIQINRLRPGTILVDDSFPHCFDVPSAIRRMTSVGDVMVMGGGLLTASPARSILTDDPVLRPYLQHLTGRRVPDTIASCQLEALLLINQPALPPVRGLVQPDLALTYWHALAELGVPAAPLHLQQHLVTSNGHRLR